MNKDEMWEKVFGVMTPGGDPYWRCPICHSSRHVVGIETEYNYTKSCNNCGAILNYPWELIDKTRFLTCRGRRFYESCK